MKVLEKPELHAISKVSAILRSISLPFLFHTVHFDARGGPGLGHLAGAYIQEQTLCKNITELRLDYRQALIGSNGNTRETFRISQADAAFFSGIDNSPMSCLTTLVLHKVTLVDLWVRSIFKSRTLRRLHIHACLCDKFTRSFPSTHINELVLQEPQCGNQEFDALVTFLAPQLEVLEVHDPRFFTDMALPTVFPATCTRLRRYVLRIPKERSVFSISCLHDFLVRTTTIEDLELSMIFPTNAIALPPSALPNLRLYDVTLSAGFPATKFITGPRKRLAILRIRDHFVLSHDLDSVQNFLDVPYGVSELHLDFRQHLIAELLPAQVDQGFPKLERLYLNIRANHLCLLPRDDPGLCRNCTVLDSNLVGVSDFVNRVKARYSIQEDDGDCSRSTRLHKLEKIDVEIEVDSIGTTTPHTLDEWFHGVVEANCPALKEVYLRIWKANDQGIEGNRASLGPRFWARWRVEVDEHWRYKWGFHLST